MATDAAGAPCAYCRQEVGAPASQSCPRCAALYHPDCWQANGRRCAVYACEPAIPSTTAPAPAWPQERLAPAEPRRIPGLWILIALGISALTSGLRGGYRSSTSDSRYSPSLPVLDMDLGRFDLPPTALEEEVDGLYARAENLIAAGQSFFAGMQEVSDLPRGRAERDAMRERALVTADGLVEARHLLCRCRASRRGASAVALANETSEAIRKLRRLAKQLEAP